ncbi:MAG: hypothetical protein EPO43_09625 [Rugosibacter sp.]|nr:MAG: hypothetical protein EPO43_09625 [Rugosibacter sp.]
MKRLLWLAHLIAACIVLGVNLSSLLQGALLLMIGTSWIKRDSTASTAALILHGDGRIEKVGAGDTPRSVESDRRKCRAVFGKSPGGTVSDLFLHPHTTVLPFLVILLYRQKNRLQSLVLLSDSLEAEDFRQLRLWLRWQLKRPPQK